MVVGRAGSEFIVPVTVMVVCYVGIVVSVRRQAGELRDIQSSRDQRQNRGHLRVVQLRTGLIITALAKDINSDLVQDYVGNLGHLPPPK